MVIKPVEFAMIQQQNNVAKSQYNAENRPMTEQADYNAKRFRRTSMLTHSRLIRRIMLIMKLVNMMPRIRVIMNIPVKGIHGRKRNLMEKSL